jgi:excisionase family DNA binding protein
MLLTIKDLAKQLQIKPSTLYAWAAQGKIPCHKINGLVRFNPAEIDRWMSLFVNGPASPIPAFRQLNVVGAQEVIARAKRDVYTSCRGNQTNSEPNGKEA